MNRTATAALALSALVFACKTPNERLNAPPHGRTETTADLQGTFVYMTDNALLADMTMCDMHFMPHRDRLTTLGDTRLQRLASLMQEYGGEIRFNTDLEDEALVSARTRTLTEALLSYGVDTTSQVVKRDLSGGKGYDAVEAILIKAGEGTYKEKKEGGNAEAAPPSAP